MDETTLHDIRQRVARWQRDKIDRNWIFAINIDDVNLMLHEIEGLERQVADLREQLKAARQYFPWKVGIDQALDGGTKDNG